MADQELDARGMTCPLPVMRAAKIMLAMKAGHVYADALELFHSRYEVPKAKLPKGRYRNISGNNALVTRKPSFTSCLRTTAKSTSQKPPAASVMMYTGMK